MTRVEAIETLQKAYSLIDDAYVHHTYKDWHIEDNTRKANNILDSVIKTLQKEQMVEDGNN